MLKGRLYAPVLTAVFRHANMDLAPATFVYVAGGHATHVGLDGLLGIVETLRHERRWADGAIARTERRRLIVEQLRAGVVAWTVGVMTSDRRTIDWATSRADGPTLSQRLNARCLTVVAGRHVISRLVVIRA